MGKRKKDPPDNELMPYVRKGDEQPPFPPFPFLPLNSTAFSISSSGVCHSYDGRPLPSWVTRMMRPTSVNPDLPTHQYHSPPFFYGTSPPYRMHPYEAIGAQPLRSHDKLDVLTRRADFLTMDNASLREEIRRLQEKKELSFALNASMEVKLEDIRRENEDDQQQNSESNEKRADEQKQNPDSDEKTADVQQQNPDSNEKTADDEHQNADFNEERADDQQQNPDSNEKIADDQQKNSNSNEKTTDDEQQNADSNEERGGQS